ncbi:MAG: adenylate/guanylate cyclase domain-containing protein [Candidatus Sumerlaeota bacterium]|nr:adenylate/guanylate cyclase domain-containing protein [Candidatus Sumerlaeota bacterium]
MLLRNKIIQGLLIGLAAAAISAAAYRAGWLAWIEDPLWDWRVRALAKPAPSTAQISLVLLDQSSLEWAADEPLKWHWPWPRAAYEAILSCCRRGGAKAVIFDSIFTENSSYGEDDDQVFGAAIGKAPDVAMAVFLSQEQGLTRHWPDDCATRTIAVEGLDRYILTPAAKQLIMPRAAFPVPAIRVPSAVLGNIYSEAEKGATVRRLAPFRVFDGRFFPTLGLAAYLAGNKGEALALTGNELRIGSRSIPLDAHGNAILRFRGPTQTHKAINAAAVIQSEMRLREGGAASGDLGLFRNRYVFFGTTAPGLLDLRATPISPIYPGVEIQATLLDNLLAGDFFREFPGKYSLLTLLILACLAGMAGRVCANGWQTSVAAVVLLPLPILAGFFAAAQGHWLPVAGPQTAIILALAGTLIVNYSVEGRQKRFIKSAFKQYLSPAVIAQIVKDPQRLRLGGETRELSIYFSDIQGFTSISEKLEPQALTALLNDYLTAMTDIIMDEGGTVDKYEGDAVIAFWNAPLDLPDHATRAVRSALRCQKKLDELRPAFRERIGGRDMRMRIGLNTGPVVIGNMGSNQRFNYTFLGDAGNLASRLEGINKQFGTYVMLSEMMLSRLTGDEFATRELSRVQVVGKKTAVRVFEPMWREEYAARREILEAFDRALRHYYDGRFEEALNGFEAIANADAPAAAYAKRCKGLIENPPAQWEGVWEMTEK